MNKIIPTTRADMVAMQMTDMWTEFMLLCYGDKFVRTYLPVSYVCVQYYFFIQAETKSDFADGLPRRFEFLDKFLVRTLHFFGKNILGCFSHYLFCRVTTAGLEQERGLHLWIFKPTRSSIN